MEELDKDALLPSRVRDKWAEFGEVTMRQVAVYPSMAWLHSLDGGLASCMIAAAPYGGPVAVTRDTTQIFRSLMGGDKDAITVYSASGEYMCAIPRFDEGGRLLHIGWSTHERLYCVYESGDVKVHTILGALTSLLCFNLFHASSDAADHEPGESLVSVAMGQDSLAAIARDGADGYLAAYLVDGLESCHVQRITDTGLARAPSCLAVLDGCQTAHGRAEVLLGSSESELLVLDPEGQGALAHRVPLAAPPCSLAISPHRPGRDSMVAVFSENGLLSVWPASLARCLLEYETGASEAPALAWCGNNGVALATAAVLEEGLLVSPATVRIIDSHCNVHETEYEVDRVVLVSEVDGLRVLCEGSLSLLQPVPAALLAVGAIGTQHPAALLEDAWASYEHSQARCYDIIRDLSSEGGEEGGARGGAAGGAQGAGRQPPPLLAAVEGCIAAALAEWDIGAQKALLNAASYGKSFVGGDGGELGGGGGGAGGAGGEEEEGGEGGGEEGGSAGAGAAAGSRGGAGGRDAFPNACKRLRILHSLRSTGLPLTNEQYELLSPRVIVGRLIQRHQFRLASAMSELLGLPGAMDEVLSEWACQRVRCVREDDDTLAKSIMRRLAKVTTVSYASIASAADAAGRRRLATLLLDCEPSAGAKVPTLLRMKERRLALEKALESGDANWVHHVLFELRLACGESGLKAAGEAGGGGGAGDLFGGGGGGEAAAAAAAVAAEALNRSTDYHYGEGGGEVEGEEGSSSSSSSEGVGEGVMPRPEDPDLAFITIILPYPGAVDLLTAWAAHCDPGLYHKLTLATGRWLGASRASAAVVYEAPGGIEARAVALKREAADLLREHGERRSRGKQRTGIRAVMGAMDEMARVRDIVRGEEGPKGVEGVMAPTLAGTLRALLRRGGKSAATADKVAKAVGLPEDSYWWVKARAYIEEGRWKELDAECGKKAHRLDALAALLEECGHAVKGKEYAAKSEAKRGK